MGKFGSTAHVIDVIDRNVTHVAWVSRQTVTLKDVGVGSKELFNSLPFMQL